MRSFAPIGIHYNFSSCQSCIPMWASDYEFSGWIDMINNICRKQGLNLRGKLLLHPWNKNINDVFFNFGQHRSFLIEIIMLGGNYDSLNDLGNVLVTVFNGNLSYDISA